MNRSFSGASISLNPEWKLVCHRWNDQSASPIASGSFRTRAMLILPCSMGTLACIQAGVAMDLIERCADVHLKEGRPLVIAPREMPFNLIHLRNLTVTGGRPGRALQLRFLPGTHR